MRVRRRSLTALVLLASLALGLALAPGADAANTGFVRAQGGQFVLDGQPFRFVGTNAYYMAIMTALGSPAHADDQIALAQALGFTVMRMWGYADGPNEGMGSSAFQPSPGVYNEQSFSALDYVLHKADLAGVRLLIPLVDGNSSYGGVNQYLAWCAPRGSERTFYEDPSCRQMYKNYVSYVLNRRNTYNGRLYKDDPTVFAWELANEPHVVNGADRSGQIVRAWVAEMAAFFKSIDANHMVATGEEGYEITTQGYSPLSAYNNQAWLFDGNKGLAWTQNTSDPNVDYANIHLYPEYWLIPASAGSTWIADHTRIARSLGKPLVLGEFGASQNTAAAYDAWLSTWETENGAGALAWIVMCQVCYGMTDQFGIPYPPSGAATDVLARFAAAANAPPGSAPFTVSGVTATPDPAAPGQAVTIAASVTAGPAASDIIVDIGIWNSAGTRVVQQAYSSQGFALGQTRSYTWPWTVPPTLPSGTYRISVGAFDATWSTAYVWVDAAGTFAVQVSATPAFTVGATSATPNPVAPGQPVTVATTVTAGAAASGIIVDVGVWNSAGTRVVQQAYSGQGFALGQTRSYTWPWTVPSTLPAGAYRVSVGVFDATWSTPYVWVDAAATFVVQAPATPSFTVGATTVAPNPVSKGQTITIATAVTAGAAASGIIVDIEIYNEQGSRIARQWFGGQTFAANQTRPYSWSWRVGSNRKAGTYTVKVGVFDGTWSTTYVRVDAAATFTVK